MQERRYGAILSFLSFPHKFGFEPYPRTDPTDPPLDMGAKNIAWTLIPQRRRSEVKETKIFSCDIVERIDVDVSTI